MKIITHIEYENKKILTETDVDFLEFEPSNKILRKKGLYYSTLKFQCKFPIDLDRGAVFSFAYGLPYVYTDLLADLHQAKKFLINNGGEISG